MVDKVRRAMANAERLHGTQQSPEVTKSYRVHEQFTHSSRRQLQRIATLRCPWTRYRWWIERKLDPV